MHGFCNHSISGIMSYMPKNVMFVRSPNCSVLRTPYSVRYGTIPYGTVVVPMCHTVPYGTARYVKVWYGTVMLYGTGTVPL